MNVNTSGGWHWSLKPISAAVVRPSGFMRFDPAALHFMTVQEVPLAPDGASVGLEIRVIGNDSGEKVGVSWSLLS